MERAERWFGWAFLFATSVLVTATFFGLQLNSSTTLSVLVVGVVLLGLPHGALDPVVARKAFASSSRYSNLTFYSAYLFAVVIYALLWMKLPTMGLAGFLVISAFHFSSDWYPRGIILTRLGYGLTVVTLPATLHGGAEAGVFALLGTAHAQTLVDISRVLAPLAVAAGGTGAILQFRQSRKDLVEFLAILAGALLLDPLVFFTCYFSLLHSPRHLLQTAEDLGLVNFQSIFLKSLPILVATVALGLLLYLKLPITSMGGRILITVFIGLAALTVPHMLLENLASEMQKRNC